MLRNTVLLLALCIITGKSYTQTPDVGNLYLTGKGVNEKKRGMQATIYLYKEHIRIDSFNTSRIGRFEFFTPLQDSLAFVVLAEDYVSKTVFVDARVPNHKKDDDYNFPFFIDLYRVGRVPSNIDLERPVGKIIFAGSQFI